jgi:hypothetical protein
MNIKTFDKNFWISSTLFVVCIGLTCYLPIWFTKQPFGKPDFTNTGTIGDTIGGTMGLFVAIAVGILTFLAFWVQYKANEQQKADMKDQKDRADIERTETRFFEMLKLHRENVNEMSYTSYTRQSNEENIKKDKDKEQTFVSRKVFKVIFSDFEKLNDELSHFFNDKIISDIYEENYQKELEKNAIIKIREIQLETYAKIDILYCILFFGVSESGIKTIEGFLKNRYKESFFRPLIKYASLKPKQGSKYWKEWVCLKESQKWIKWDKWNEELYKKDNLSWDDLNDQAKYEELHKGMHLCSNCLTAHNSKLGAQNIGAFYGNWDFFKYYGGHQFRLGHYFRNLYQTVSYINDDDSTLLDYKRKYENIKVLRGQLSTYEQLIIFINSISVLGRVWELEMRNEPAKAKDINKQLITKYNFIKNIAYDEIIEGVSISKFYPDITYEAKNDIEVIERRKKLEENYKKGESSNDSNIKNIKFYKIPLINWVLIKKDTFDEILEKAKIKGKIN